MKNLKLHWTSDESECETCGYSFDCGLVATLDDVVIYDDPACPGCLNEERSPEDHFKELLEALGYNVVETDEEFNEDT